MTIPVRRTRRGAATLAVLLATALAVALAVAACGSSHPARPGASDAASRPGPALATSLAGSGGSSWAVVQMGGSASANDNFWELLGRLAGGADWKVVTPAGVASNGGLVVAQSGSGTLITGFRPSQDLTFSPLAASVDAGGSWSQRPPLSPGLANVPGALAADSAGRLLALTDAGDVDAGTAIGATWTRLTTLRALANSAAGRACGLTALTAVAWTPAGLPLAAGDCRKPGGAGIFTESSGSWQRTGPALSGAAAATGADVIGLASTGDLTTAVLAVGSGATSAVVAAWSPDGGAHWTLSPVLRTPALAAAGAKLSVSFFADGAAGLVLGTAAGHASASRAYTLGWRAGRWAALPPLPARSGAGQFATLAATAAGVPQALVVNRGTLTVWQLGSGQWALLQTVRVAIPYGSSG